MSDPKLFLTRNGILESLDQIVAAAKSEGMQVFADGDWVFRIDARRRSKVEAKRTVNTLSHEDIEKIFSQIGSKAG